MFPATAFQSNMITALLVEALRSKGAKFNEEDVLYGYDLNSSKNYAMAFTEARKLIYILQIEVSAVTLGDLIIIDESHKVKKDIFGVITITPDVLDKNIKLSVPKTTSRNAGALGRLPIVQIDTVKHFYEFIKSFKGVKS